MSYISLLNKVAITNQPLTAEQMDTHQNHAKKYSLCLAVDFSLLCIFREGRVMGTLEVSRSIGDGRFKHCGVVSTPDVFRCQLTENDL